MFFFSRRDLQPIKMLIVGMVLLISMVIDSAYTGGLASVMTMPRYSFSVIKNIRYCTNKITAISI